MCTTPLFDFTEVIFEVPFGVWTITSVARSTA